MLSAPARKKKTFRDLAFNPEETRRFQKLYAILGPSPSKIAMTMACESLPEPLRERFMRYHRDRRMEEICGPLYVQIQSDPTEAAVAAISTPLNEGNRALFKKYVTVKQLEEQCVQLQRQKEDAHIQEVMFGLDLEDFPLPPDESNAESATEDDPDRELKRTRERLIDTLLELAFPEFSTSLLQEFKTDYNLSKDNTAGYTAVQERYWDPANREKSKQFEAYSELRKLYTGDLIKETVFEQYTDVHTHHGTVEEEGHARSRSLDTDRHSKDFSELLRKTPSPNRRSKSRADSRTSPELPPPSPRRKTFQSVQDLAAAGPSGVADERSNLLAAKRSGISKSLDAGLEQTHEPKKHASVFGWLHKKSHVAAPLAPVNEQSEPPRTDATATTASPPQRRRFGLFRRSKGDE